MAEPKTKTTHGGSSAFTLIEIIVVVLILSIAALIAVPMMSSAADIQVRAAANRLAADLEYAKNMAITHQRPFTVKFLDTSTTNGYQVQDSSENVIDNPLRPRNNPADEGTFKVIFSTEDDSLKRFTDPNLSRVQVDSADFIGTDSNSADSVTFDYLGTPHSGTTPNNSLNSGIITLRDTAGNLTLTVNVEPMTGYVSIE